MAIPTFHPRFSLSNLTTALQDTPVVLIHGPRQCGKTTLARTVGDEVGYSYISFDDDVLRASVKEALNKSILRTPLLVWP